MVNYSKKQFEFTKKPGVSISFRILIPLYTTCILFILSIFFVFTPQQEKQLLNQKKETIRQLTNNVISSLYEINLRIEQNEITPEKAREQAINQIRSLRYGPTGKDYFWIIDTNHFMVMHPYHPDLEGNDLSYRNDGHGNFPVAAMVKKASASQGGYVNYHYQRNDGTQIIASKTSYVKRFPPWNWVVGTGIFTDDIHNEIKLVNQRFIQIFAGIFAFIILLSIYITKQVFQIEHKNKLAESEKELEELRLNKLLELSNMAEESITTLTDFALEETAKLIQSEFGFLAFLNEDESHLALHLWPKQAIKKEPIDDKKMEYNIKGVSLLSEAVRYRKEWVVNDYENSDICLKKGFPNADVKISRIMTVPVFDGDKIAALGGVGNKKQPYNDSDIRQLKLMMDGIWQILQRKNAQIDLKSSEERYRLLADNATDTIWVLQLPELKSIYISPSMKHLLGYTPSEFSRLEMKTYMTPKSLKKVPIIIAEELNQEFDSESSDPIRLQTVEIEMIRKDGTTIWVEITASLLKNDKGEPDRILWISRDISERIQADEERKKLQEHLAQARKMEAVGVLAGGITHDFNNILSGLMGFTGLAMLEAGDNEDLKSYLAQVSSASLRARDLVSHILTFSRKSDTQRQPIMINPIIKESLKFIRASLPASIEIQQDLRLEQGQVFGDATQIYQILISLFTNAGYAMKDKGGILEVMLDRVTLDETHTGYLEKISPGQFIQLTLSDTGCGIHKKNLDRVFEPFFTTKGRGEGTGMGLAIVYGIIKEMAGSISVYSKVDIGTTFRILLPEHHQAQIRENDVNNTFKIGRGNILIIDDEKAIVDSSYELLTRLGYSATTKTDSLEALEHVKNNPKQYDLILTDMTMPQLNGFELAKQIKEINPDIPIVLNTGFSHGLTKEKCKSAGITEMVMKPMTGNELSSAIEKAITRKKG